MITGFSSPFIEEGGSERFCVASAKLEDVADLDRRLEGDSSGPSSVVSPSTHGADVNPSKAKSRVRLDPFR